MRGMDSIETILRSEIDPAYALRSRLICQKIIEKKPQSILDAGCGRGFYVKLFAKLEGIRTIAGVDINPDYVAQAKEITNNFPQVQIQHASLETLPFANASFDFIVCSEVIEHVPDESKVLRELHRVLKPGGTLVVTVPNERFPFFWDPSNWLLM
jgi:ubiquinone/menaquinone biosynthesis C-methylase UbiE